MSTTPPLSTAQNALHRARGGAGATVLVAGRAGSGLSHALASADATATRMGVVLARARGRMAERPLDFGVAVELLAGFVDAVDDEARRGPGAPAIGLLSPTTADTTRDGGLAIIRSFWALAARTPGGLAMIVDDLHDVDGPTLRLLAYGAARLDEWPIALIASRRLGARSAEPAALDAITRISPAVRPQPLDAAHAAALVRGSLPDATPELCAACVSATGANPALLVALASDLSAVHGPTVELDPESVRRSPGPAVQALLTERMARLPAPALRLALTLAARDGAIAPAQAVAASGLTRDEAALAIDALVADGLLAEELPLALAQPIAGSAIRTSLTLGERLRPTMISATATVASSPAGAPSQSEPTPAAPAAVDTLTPSESRVAELAARGMTTREIATTLFVTPKTVEFHLRNVYRKLEIPSSRRDLARALVTVGQQDERRDPRHVTVFPSP